MKIVVGSVLVASLSIVACSCGGGPNANEFGQGCNAQQGTTLSVLHEPYGRRGPNSLQPGFQFHDGRNHHRDPLELFCRSSRTMSDALILRMRIQQVLAVLALREKVSR